MQKVSVVIPAYNAARSIERAVDSVLTQTFQAWEIVVIDDGSTDDIRAVVKKYGPAIRYIDQKENKGVSAARNQGIAQSTGDWIAFFDADDEWLPTKLERQMRILTENPQLKWCACNMERMKNNISQAPSISLEKQKQLISDQTVPFFVGALSGLELHTSGFVIHQQVFSEIGVFNPCLLFSEDRDLWWRIAMTYPLIGYSTDVCYRYYTDTVGSLKNKTKDRSRVLQTTCDHMRRVQELNAEAAASYRPYGRFVTVDFLLRNASREVALDPAVIKEASMLFGINQIERLLIFTLKCLPARPARKVAGLFQEIRKRQNWRASQPLTILAD